jgi:hypothetical protein
MESEQQPSRKKRPDQARPAAARPPGLSARLRSAPAEEVEALIAAEGERFGLADLRAVVRNPYARGETLEALAARKSLMAVYEARALVARHRRTPQVVAMRFVGGLFWHDLLEIALDVRLAGPLRRLAEKYLLQRLPRLAVGERVSLARRAPEETLERLCADVDLRVAEAALENPRLTEERLLPFLAGSKATPRRLALVARHPRWGCCYEVRLALCRNPLSPLAAVLAQLPFLRRSELEALATDQDLPALVRFAASEQLAAKAEGIESAQQLFDLETPGG